MLKRLFSSTVRADILALLLNNPDEKFYIRELAEILQKNPSGVKRELDNLEKLGIAVSERVANLKYFRANKESPFFSELRNLVTKSLGLSGALKSVLQAGGAKAAFILGPHAEGIETGTVDLFVVGGVASLKKYVENIEKKFNVSIRIRQVSEADFKSMRKERDEEFMRLLEGKKTVLFGKF